MRGTNAVSDVNANQSRVIKCYNCKGEGHIAKQCTAKKRVVNDEWFKEKMLLAQAQEASVILHEDQQEFLANRLEEIDSDYDDLQLHTTSNFKVDHVDAYDSDCDDEATTYAIFMASLSPAGSIIGDTVGPSYDSKLLSMVPHYDTYHEDTILNDVVQEMEYNDYVVFNDNSCDELMSNTESTHEQTDDELTDKEVKKMEADFQNVENQNRLIVVPGIANQNTNQNGNGNVVASHAEDSVVDCSEGRSRIQIQAKEFNLMDAARDIDNNEEVNLNYILMANLQQASTSGTQIDKAPVYDSDRSADQGGFAEELVADSARDCRGLVELGGKSREDRRVQCFKIVTGVMSLKTCHKCSLRFRYRFAKFVLGFNKVLAVDMFSPPRALTLSGLSLDFSTLPVCS
uniref:CCHC-type domain-containing protein n=1 Tax=Tanacetum cinerariifolium TaxID=118510 RepID=A0A6L2M0D6_TANCI|nr:hypothetical protein [Tanacetum cinerariifolium]